MNKEQVPEYRYEKKYIVNSLQIEILRNRIELICFPDPHAKESGSYNIRSLYFDDYYDRAYRANERGTEPRAKWRIRVYNHENSLIRLEHKKKRMGKVHKDTAFVTPEFCQQLLAGEIPEISYPTDNSIINQFLLEYHNHYLRPKIIIEYNREPYLFREGDVRITFDKNIAYSPDVNRFFCPDLFRFALMETGKHLLEVKYTQFLPSVVYESLETGRLLQTTFSKYYLSRNMAKIGGVLE